MTKAVNRSSKANPSRERNAKARADSGKSADTAKYIAEFTAELSYLARRDGLDLLAYLLDMARLEAVRAVQARHERD